MPMATNLLKIPGWLMPFGHTLALISLICILAYPAPGHGAVYKWVDEQGKVHYGSQPPANTQPERMKINIPPPVKTSKPAPDEKKGEDGEQGGENKQQQAQQPEEPKLSKADKAKLCQNARARLSNAQANARLRVSDEKGQNRIISEQERQQRIALARKDVREFCR